VGTTSTLHGRCERIWHAVRWVVCELVRRYYDASKQASELVAMMSARATSTYAAHEAARRTRKQSHKHTVNGSASPSVSGIKIENSLVRSLSRTYS